MESGSTEKSPEQSSAILLAPARNGEAILSGSCSSIREIRLHFSRSQWRSEHDQSLQSVRTVYGASSRLGQPQLLSGIDSLLEHNLNAKTSIKVEQHFLSHSGFGPLLRKHQKHLLFILEHAVSQQLALCVVFVLELQHFQGQPVGLATVGRVHARSHTP